MSDILRLFPLCADYADCVEFLYVQTLLMCWLFTLCADQSLPERSAATPWGWIYTATRTIARNHIGLLEIYQAKAQKLQIAWYLDLGDVPGLHFTVSDEAKENEPGNFSLTDPLVFLWSVSLYWCALGMQGWPGGYKSSSKTSSLSLPSITM